MKKALVAANNKFPANIMELTAQMLESLKLEGLEIFRASSKRQALEHLSYGDVLFTVLEDDLRGAEAVAESARAIDSKLILITSSTDIERFKRYKPRVVKKPDYYDVLSQYAKGFCGVKL